MYNEEGGIMHKYDFLFCSDVQINLQRVRDSFHQRELFVRDFN